MTASFLLRSICKRAYAPHITGMNRRPGNRDCAPDSIFFGFSGQYEGPHGESDDREESFGAPDVQTTPLVALVRPSAQTILLSNQLQGSISAIQTLIYCENHKIDVLYKFSFGPSQADEGQKKTVHSMEGSCLNPHHIRAIHSMSAQRCESKAHLRMSGRALFQFWMPSVIALMNCWWYFLKFLPAVARVIVITRSFSRSTRSVQEEAEP